MLVIRGELLKKYPNAVIYAHRADWEQRDVPTGAIDKKRPRKLRDLAPAQEANPPRDIVKTPLYEAKVEPDIYFFGFDLTAERRKAASCHRVRPKKIPAGSSSSRSGRASRASASMLRSPRRSRH